MKATIKTYQSGPGDCIFFQLEEDAKRYAIMIDCGDYTEEIKAHVENTLNKHIDLLIVTHIDSDHILGIEEMLKATPELEIGKIIFNCYQRKQENVISLTPKQIQRLESIEGEVNSVFRDVIEQDVSAQQAVKGLAKAILNGDRWKLRWEREYRALDATNEESTDDWGTIKILAPTMKEIHALDDQFKSLLFTELFTEADGVEYDDSDSLYEILLRYADLHAQEVCEEHETAGGDLEQTLMDAAEEPVKESSITPANKASLAFVWEKGDKRMLFLGDAMPSLVIKGLVKHYPNGPFPMRFEAIKVAHHGSHYNTTEALMNLIDSEQYFLTGGEEGIRPSEAALGRILLQPLRSGVTQRTLHVNYKTELTDKLNEDKVLQEKYHFAIDYDQNEHAFTL